MIHVKYAVPVQQNKDIFGLNYQIFPIPGFAPLTLIPPGGRGSADPR